MRRLMAASIALFGVCIAQAQADQMSVSYKLKPQACRIIPLPVLSVPIHLIAANQATNSTEHLGIGELTITSMNHFIGESDAYLVWVGIDTTAKISTGNSDIRTAHLLWVGYDAVEMQVWSGKSVRICNFGTSPLEHGTVTMFW